MCFYRPAYRFCLYILNATRIKLFNNVSLSVGDTPNAVWSCVGVGARGCYQGFKHVTYKRTEYFEYGNIHTRYYYNIIHYVNHYRNSRLWLSQKFVEKFSRELNTEYGGKGKHGSNITVQCVTPGYVATKMSKIARTSWLVPSPDTFVKSALQTTGLEPVTTGYFPHTLMVSYYYFN